VLFRWGRLSVGSKQGDVTRYQPAILVLIGNDWHRVQDLWAHRSP